MSIKIHTEEAVDCVFVSPEQYNCSVAPSEKFRNLKNLLVGEVSVVMVDQQGRSCVGYNAFDLEIKLNKDFLLDIIEWMGENLWITAIIAVVVLLSVLGCAYFVYRERQKTLGPTTLGTVAKGNRYSHQYQEVEVTAEDRPL